jgi:CubicO group peptidase (beta-lactamase class C family)
MFVSRPAQLLYLLLAFALNGVFSFRRFPVLPIHDVHAQAQGSLITRGPPQAVLTADVDTFINAVLSSWNSAGGFSVAVVQKAPDGSWSVETKGYGVATSNGTKVDSDTLFSIGSNSKVGWLQLIDERLILKLWPCSSLRHLLPDF